MYQKNAFVFLLFRYLICCQNLDWRNCTDFMKHNMTVWICLFPQLNTFLILLWNRQQKQWWFDSTNYTELVLYSNVPCSLYVLICALQDKKVYLIFQKTIFFRSDISTQWLTLWNVFQVGSRLSCKRGRAQSLCFILLVRPQVFPRCSGSGPQNGKRRRAWVRRHILSSHDYPTFRMIKTMNHSAKHWASKNPVYPLSVDQMTTYDITDGNQRGEEPG